MKNNPGLTLIEVVIFIAVASIGFLILSASYTVVLEQSTTGEFLSIATTLCEGKMEETMAAYSFDTLPDPNILPLAFDPPFASYTYQVTWFYINPSNLNEDAGSPTDYKNVRIIVDHEGIEPVSMTTILADY